MTAKLIRGLGPIDAAALVVGTIIGTGVFLKTGPMAQLVGSPGMVMLAWIVAGLLSLSGALTYAELGALFPKAGGEYIYLKEAYGNIPAFLYGWMRFWIGGPGTIASYAVGAAGFLSGAVNLNVFGGPVPVAIFFIALFTGLNCLRVSFGGRLNAIITGIKVVIVFALAFGVLFFSNTGSLTHFSEAASDSTGFHWGPFGLAMLAALWAFDGWNNLPMAAGEVKNPGRNIPLSLGFGMLLVLALYGAANLAFFYGLPFSEILTSRSNAYPDGLPVATKAAETFMGAAGVIAISLAFVFSSLGAMTGSILTGSRVPYAMANDGLFLKALAKVNEKTNVPVLSILTQSLVAAVLACWGTFDQLTDYTMFASWIFYALVTFSVFIFRKKLKDTQRSYSVTGYPFVPMVFIVLSILLVLNTLNEMPKESGMGLAIILAGIPFYYLFKKLNKPAVN